MGRGVISICIHLVFSGSKSFYPLQILKLQRQLEDQLVVRHALENALSYQPLSHEAATDESIPKVTIKHNTLIM